MGTHLEASLQHDMDLIRSKVSEMSALCERAVTSAVRAVVDQDRQSAYLVILRDQQIDELEQQLDRLCLEFLVRQQPAAGHLRFAYAAIKISTELERVGDHAEAIVRRVIRLSERKTGHPPPEYQEMGNASLAMLREATRAFVQQDAALAHTTMQVEQRVDKMRRALDGTLLRMQRANELDLDQFLLLSTISRRLERITDELRDICAETIYMVTGDYVKHKAPEVFRVLFVDQHDHCRSQMAYAIASSLDLPRLLFTSAGLDPRSIDPRLGPFLAEKGLDLTYHRPKSLDQVPHLSHYHVVVAFDESAYYALRFRRTPTVCIDWPVEDPSAATGTPEEIHAAYERTYETIRAQLLDLIDAISSQEKP